MPGLSEPHKPPMDKPSNDPDELEGRTLHRLSVKAPDGGWLDLHLLDVDEEAGDEWYVRIIRSAAGEPRRHIARRDVAAMRRQRRPRGPRDLIAFLRKSGIYGEELAAELCGFALAGRRHLDEDQTHPLDRLAIEAVRDCPGIWKRVLSRSGHDRFGGYSSDVYARKSAYRADAWDLLHVHDDGTLQEGSFTHAGDLSTVGEAIRSKFGFGDESERSDARLDAD